MHIPGPTIAQWESRYRAAFANSLTGFKSGNLVGTSNSSGRDNLAIMTSAVHLGSHPPLIMLVIRPDVAERHTLSNILETGVYTLNHIGANAVERAHQTAARYPADISEFDAVGLTRRAIPDFLAPAVAESPLSMGLELREERKLEINGTHLVIGEVVWVELDEAIVGEDGYIDIEAATTVAVSGLDSYHRSQRHCRMEYAKPDLSPRRQDVVKGA